MNAPSPLRETGPAARGQALAAARYANEADTAFRRRARILGGWIAEALGATPDLRLADIGCGRGFYLPLYRDLGVRHVVAVEGVEANIRAARPRASEATLVCGNAESLPLPDGSLDIVVMSEVIEHFPQEAPPLAEALRVLKPGGRLLASVPNANYPALWDPINWSRERLGLKPVRDGFFGGIWAGHERLYTPGQLEALIAGAGFRVDEVSTHTRRCMPFIHNVVYGLGKTMLDKGARPASWVDSAARGEAGATGRRSWFDPVRFGIRVAHWFDRNNPDAEPDGKPTVNVMLRATRV